MQSEAIAGRYARAMIDIATSQEKVEAFGKELGDFLSYFEASEELRVALSNPSIPQEQRMSVLDALLERLKPSAMIANFLRLLVERRRILVFPAIVRCYNAQADEKADRSRGVVISPTELSAAQQKKLGETLSKALGREVLLENRVDAHLIGGLRVEVDGKTYDGSVRGHLDRMREQLRRIDLSKI